MDELFVALNEVSPSSAHRPHPSLITWILAMGCWLVVDRWRIPTDLHLLFPPVSRVPPPISGLVAVGVGKGGQREAVR